VSKPSKLPATDTPLPDTQVSARKLIVTGEGRLMIEGDWTVGELLDIAQGLINTARNGVVRKTDFAPAAEQPEPAMPKNGQAHQA